MMKTAIAIMRQATRAIERYFLIQTRHGDRYEYLARRAQRC
jgi:hypothetical protein